MESEDEEVPAFRAQILIQEFSAKLLGAIKALTEQLDRPEIADRRPEVLNELTALLDFQEKLRKVAGLSAHLFRSGMASCLLRAGAGTHAPILESLYLHSPEYLDSGFARQFYPEISQWLPGMRFSLLYRASRDGRTSADFHRLCDNRGPTLVLVHTHGNVFGGYCSGSWDTSGEWKDYEGCFLFTLRNQVADLPAVFHFDLEIKDGTVQSDFPSLCVDPTRKGKTIFGADLEGIDPEDYSEYIHRAPILDYEVFSVFSLK